MKQIMLLNALVILATGCEDDRPTMDQLGIHIIWRGGFPTGLTPADAWSAHTHEKAMATPGCTAVKDSRSRNYRFVEVEPTGTTSLNTDEFPSKIMHAVVSPRTGEVEFVVGGGMRDRVTGYKAYAFPILSGQRLNLYTAPHSCKELQEMLNADQAALDPPRYTGP